jgi:hypothetical protein
MSRRHTVQRKPPASHVKTYLRAFLTVSLSIYKYSRAQVPLCANRGWRSTDRIGPKEKYHDETLGRRRFGAGRN